MHLIRVCLISLSLFWFLILSTHYFPSQFPAGPVLLPTSDPLWLSVESGPGLGCGEHGCLALTLSAKVSPQHSSPLHVGVLGIFCCPAAAGLKSWARAKSMGTQKRLTIRWISHKWKFWIDWPVFIYTSKTKVRFQTFSSKQLLNQKQCSVFFKFG